MSKSRSNYGSFLVMIAVSLVVSCDSPRKAELTGIYLGSESNVTERLKLSSDGTFHQEILSTPKGQWRIDDKWSLKERAVRLEKCYLTHDPTTGRLLKEPMLVY